MTTRTYTSTQDVTVPANYDGNGITVDVYGGAGGDCAFGGTTGSGGNGGRITGVLTTPAPGDILHLVIATRGGKGFGSGTAGLGGTGYGNGGAGGLGQTGGASSGGGGGASAISINGAVALLVVAGGGGASNGHGVTIPGGAGGGSTGADGGGLSGGGGGGTPSAAGAGGSAIGSATANGHAGSSHNGGGGANGNYFGSPNGYSGGGGGGGGYFGGGGGGSADNSHSAGGGGGGSSYYDPAFLSSASSTQGASGASGDGKIVLTYNLAPNQPTLNTPADGSALDPTIVQRFAWTFSDDDPGDSQSKFDLRYSSDGGVTWTTITQTTTRQYYNFNSGVLADGSYQWQVRTYDSLGAQGLYSPSLFFTVAETPGAPTITYPASGGTVGSEDHVDWSIPSQDGYQVQVLSASLLVFDSGEVDDPDARTQTLGFAVSGAAYTIKVRVISGGIWSPYAIVNVTASFTPPPAPVVVFGTADPNPDGRVTALQAVWTTPAGDSGVGQPDAQWVDVFLSTDGGVTSALYATQQPVSGSWTFQTPAGGLDYSVQAVAHSNESAQTASGWTL